MKEYKRSLNSTEEEMKEKIIILIFIIIGVLFATHLTADEEGSKLAKGDKGFDDLCMIGSPEEVKAAINNGMDVNTKFDEHDFTPPLIAASWNPSPEVVATLIQHGADLNARDRYPQWTCLIMAICNNDNPQVAITLIDRGADVNAHDAIGDSPLFYAANRGRLDLVKYLIEKGAKLESSATHPLIGASAAGHLEVVKYLIEEKGSPVNVTDMRYGETPLYYAKKWNHKEVVDCLLSHGAENNVEPQQ